MKKYGTPTPPDIKIQNIHDFPIAMIVGQTDELATVTDAQWIIKNLGDDSLRLYREVPGGHLSFLLAEDMSFFDDVVKFVANHLQRSEQE